MTRSWRGLELGGESQEQASGPCGDQGAEIFCQNRTGTSSNLLAPNRQALTAPRFAPTPPPRPEVNPAYAVIDATRAVLASLVAFSHAWYLVVRDYQPGDGVLAGVGYFVAGFAHACVIIFFVLSGYWITRSVGRRLHEGWSWKSYLVDRVVRLEVVLIPALAFGGIVDAIGYYGFQTATHLAQTNTFVMRADLGSTLRPDVFIANLVFLQGIAVLPFGSNGPLWSVGYEFWYYLWFPALALSVRQRRASWSLILLMVGLWSVPLVMGFLSWLCGSAVYVAERRWCATNARYRRVRLLVAVIAAGTVSVVLLIARFKDFWFEDVLLAAACGVLLTASLIARLGLPPVMIGLARFGAQSSFTLYATHFPIMALIGGLVVDHERLDPGSSGMLIVIILLATTIVLSATLSKLTESRTAEIRNWASRHLRT